MKPPHARWLIHNARLWSDGATLEDADAIAIEGGRILAIGRERELGGVDGAARVDAQGATVTPGLTDAHIHLCAWARSLGEIALENAASAAAAAERVAPHAKTGRVIVGRGWDANRWTDAPHRSLLDHAACDRPVLLHSKDFHAMWVNSAALAAAGVTRDTPDPSGGVIERDASGEPTGVLREHAVRLMIPIEHGASLREGALEDAVRRLHAAGITAIHDFEGPEAFRTLSLLAAGKEPHAPAGPPRVRVLMNLAHAGLDQALALGLSSGVGDDFFRLGAVKLFADGTLGSRTAAMIEPYEGGGTGMDLIEREDLKAIVRRALEGGIAVAVHAIGDRATCHVLDAFEAAGPARTRPRLPSRIEHLQLVAAEDFARIARLGIVASMQPRHAVSDLAIADRGWGARCARAYAWRRMLDHGVALAFGSDAPVEAPDAAEGLRCALTRRRADGSPDGGWYPGEALSLNEALSCYTSEPARLAGSHPRLGTLRPGALADLVVWSDDLHAKGPMALAEASPVLTMIEGDVVHRVAAPDPMRAGGASARRI